MSHLHPQCPQERGRCFPGHQHEVFRHLWGPAVCITICDIPEALMPSPEVHTYINTNHGQKQVMQMCEQAACTFLLLFA